ncbi:MAG: DUF4129 domain-containing protein [Planctomycetota bacterium]
MTVSVLLVLYVFAAPAPVATADTRHDETAKAQLEEVMRDPLFSRWQQRQARSAKDSPKNGWSLERYGEGFGNLFERFFDWLFERNPSPQPSPTGAGGDAGAWFGSIGAWFKVLGWALLVATLGLIGWVVLSNLRRQKAIVARGTPDRQALDTALDGADALAADSQAWTNHARELAEEQDLRLAFRAMYLALLSGLHQAGKIRYRPQRTNRWYVEGFRGPEAERTSFAGLTDRFGEVWYGQQVPDALMFTQVGAQVEQLLHRSSVSDARAKRPTSGAISTKEGRP